MSRPMPNQQPASAHRSHVQRPSPPGQTLSASALPRARSDESWIEVSSQPSSSSLSSAGDEIVTDGLRVQHDSNTRRRRRMPRRATIDYRQSGPHDLHRGGSSQEEYEESETDSDRIMTSSNEALQPSPLAEQWRPPGADYARSSASSTNAYVSDDDENATAIGRPRDNRFKPQPNIFTQSPPVRGAQQSSNSRFPPRVARSNSYRHSAPSRENHSPYNVVSPSHQTDHDAALRASLSTLLSCAAAARGLAKSTKSGAEVRSQAGPSNRVDAATIGMVPESALFGGPSQRPTEVSALGPVSGSRAAAPASDEKSKRKATSTTPAVRSSSKDRRALKKARHVSSAWTPATMEDVSPTLLTWVVSAGVIVFVSAIGFSAGYAVGRENGRTEVLAGHVCGRNALEGAGRGLRRLRLTDAASSIRV